MELVFKRAGGEIRLTEKEVLKIYKDSRATLIEETKREEDIAMFIVNHTRLAKLPGPYFCGASPECRTACHVQSSRTA
jgi:hypothetical protein